MTADNSKNLKCFVREIIDRYDRANCGCCRDSHFRAYYNGILSIFMRFEESNFEDIDKIKKSLISTKEFYEKKSKEQIPYRVLITIDAEDRINDKQFLKGEIYGCNLLLECIKELEDC